VPSIEAAPRRRELAPDELAVVARLGQRYAHLAAVEQDLAELERQRARPDPIPRVNGSSPSARTLRPSSVAELLQLHGRGIISTREARVHLGYTRAPGGWLWRTRGADVAARLRPLAAWALLLFVAGIAVIWLLYESLVALIRLLARLGG